MFKILIFLFAVGFGSSFRPASLNRLKLRAKYIRMKMCSIQSDTYINISSDTRLEINFSDQIPKSDSLVSDNFVVEDTGKLYISNILIIEEKSLFFTHDKGKIIFNGSFPNSTLNDITEIRHLPKVNIRMPKWYSPRGEDNELAREVVAGVVAALVTIPTSIAYASLIGLNPLLGIWTSFFVGLGVSVIGGGPGLVAGASGVVAVPLLKLTSMHGLHTLPLAVMLASAIEILFGFSRLGKYTEHVSEPVIVGFLNAFSIFLFKNQVRNCYFHFIIQ